VIELDGARREQLIDQWATRLERWGLEPLAPILFQVLRPLGFIGSQAVLFGQPLLTLLADAQTLEELSALLDDPDALGQIEHRLTGVDRPAP
jgi:hypothetical protein